MKIALCQMEVVAKRPDLNTARAMKMLDEAKANGAELIAFSEMVIPGYMVGDLWEDESFLMDCTEHSKALANYAMEQGVVLVMGTVSSYLGWYGTGSSIKYNDGRISKFNSACLVDPKYGSHWHHKMNRPNYREFDDKRYFDRAANQTLAVLHGDSVLSQSICEDGWDTDYDTKPIEKIAAHINKLYNSQEISNLHFNLSCSPFTKGKNGARNRRFAKHSEEFDGLFYINCVGIQNNGKNVFTFDGGTTVYSRGEVLGALPPLQECIGYVQAEKQKVTLLGDNWESTQRDPDLKDVLVYGTQKFLEQCGVKKVVIGLSGGIDSALSAMIHVKAVGAQNVVLVNMPTQYNSNTTKGIAADIAKNLGCPYMVVPIGDICASIQSAITAPLKGVYVEKGDGIGKDASHPLYDVNERYQEDSENIAARMRGAGIQAALAAGLKAVFPNNGNKSELTVGYCVLPDQYTWMLSRGYGYLGDVTAGDTEKPGNRVLQTTRSVKKVKITIQTALGDSLRCSEDHLVKVLDRGTSKVQFKKACDLDRKTDLVCYRVGGKVFGDKTHLGVYRHSKSVMDFRSEDVAFPEELTEEVAKLLGVCLADGSYGTKNVYTITSTKDYVHDFIKKACLSLGLSGSCLSDRKSVRYGVLGIRICNSQFVGWLQWLGVKNGAGIKDVPQCLRHAPESIIRAFLSGLFLDSSCNSTPNVLREITYHSGSEGLADFVHHSLLNLGILNYKRVYHSKNPKHLPRWEVYIPSVETERLLSVLQPIKESLGARAADNTRARIKNKGGFDYVYGHSAVRIQLARFFERNGEKANSLRYPGCVSRPVAMKWLEHPLIDKATLDDKIDQEALQGFIESTYGIERFFHITDISSEVGTFPMMDLSMETEHEYLVNGMVVHNCTVYGDLGGYMAPLADLWKYEVYEVAKQLSDEMGGILPDIIFTLKPSAELSANHNVDKGQGDPLTYWYHDKLLASWMEPWSRRGIEGTLEDFKEGKLLLNLGLLEYAPQFIQLFPSTKAFIDDAERWWKLFNQSVFKRVQAPPVLVVSRRAYGFDFRESIGGVGYTSRYMALKEILLAKKDGV